MERTSRVFRFGPFELDPSQQSLCRKGVRVRVAVSRLRLLQMLVSRPGDLITREEIATVLWDKSAFVDTVSGINTAVNQLRGILGDDSAHPTYIETVIGAGYRFIADVVATEKRAIHDSHSLPAQECVPFPPAPATLPASSVPAAMPGPGKAEGGGKRLFLVLFPAAFAVAALLLLAHGRRAVSRSTVSSPRSLQLTRVTGDGDLEFADISPDGRYFAYVRNEETGHSLWLQELAFGSALELARLGKDECPGLTFSPDGRFIYFLRKAPLQARGELDRIPVLGGGAVRMLGEVSGAPAISPDGRSVAFVRSTLLTHGEDSIVVASLDGSFESVLRTYGAPGVHFNRISWTADGRSLVFPAPAGLTMLRTDGAAERILLTPSWGAVDDVYELGASGDLVVVCEKPEQPYAQVLQLSGKGGAPRAVTHDLANYITIRATSDGQTLLALQDLVLNSLDIFDPKHGSVLRRLGAENQDHDGVDGLTWTEDGNLFYSSVGDQHRWLRVMKLSNDLSPAIRYDIPGSMLSDPAASRRGGFLALVQWQEADVANVWRVNSDGTDARRLTSGKQDLSPSVTPDGRWIVYESVEGNRSILKKIPSEGGTPVALTDYGAGSPAISPDGKWIACSYTPSAEQRSMLAIIPLGGGPPAKVFPLPETADLRPAWTPDGSAVSFINHVEGADNVWRQPLSGGPPAMVTHFNAGKIFRFQWSGDGRIALARGSETVDAVLVKNFHDPS